MGEPRRTHQLKIWPEYFQAAHEGRKRFEIRVNDRDYRVGDRLELQEYVPGVDGGFTGAECDVDVTYILSGGVFGLPGDQVVMSIELARSEGPHPESGEAAKVRHCGDLKCFKAQRCMNRDHCGVKAFESKISREWFEKRAALEGDLEIGAGGLGEYAPPPLEGVGDHIAGVGNMIPHPESGEREALDNVADGLRSISCDMANAKVSETLWRAAFNHALTIEAILCNWPAASALPVVSGEMANPNADLIAELRLRLVMAKAGGADVIKFDIPDLEAVIAALSLPRPSPGVSWEEVAKALEPFVTWAKNNVGPEGWEGLGCQRERIVDWFGPSDFRRLSDLLAALSRGEG